MKMGNIEFAGWCVLELMGHRRLGGYVRAVELAGAPFFRIDVPGPAVGPPEGEGPPGECVATQFYSPGSVYCLTPCSAEAALAVARGNQPAPVHTYELPHRPQAEWPTPRAEAAEDDEERGPSDDEDGYDELGY